MYAIRSYYDKTARSVLRAQLAQEAGRRRPGVDGAEDGADAGGAGRAGGEQLRDPLGADAAEGEEGEGGGVAGLAQPLQPDRLAVGSLGGGEEDLV